MSYRFIISCCFSFLLFSCTKNQNGCDVAFQRFIHKYGFEVSPKEWEERNQDGQIITTLNNKTTETASYQRGILHGTTTITYPATTLIKEKLEYDEGVLIKKTYYDLDQAPIKEETYDTNKTIITTWGKHGIPQSIEEYQEETLVNAQYFDQQNKLESTICDGKGERIKRNYAGLIIAKEQFENGQLISRQTFHDNGQTQSKSYFVNHKLEGLQQFFAPNGKLICENNWKNGELEGMQYCYRHEKKHIEVPYVNGKKQGVEKEYNLQGALVQELYWDKGLKHGPCRSYYTDYTDIQWFYQDTLVDLKKYQQLELRDKMIVEINGQKETKIVNDVEPKSAIR